MRQASFGFVVLLAVFSMAGSAQATARAEGAPTFAKDVAPILFENCVTCHRPGEVAPMSLLTYEEARPWSRAIKEKVVNREMPFWNADPRFGTFRNDRRLTQEEIDTIVAWADAGAPKGNPADMPPAPQFAEGWVYGPPDYVLEMPLEYQIPADGEVANLTFYSKVPFEKDYFAARLEMRPSNRPVVHHANVTLVPLDPPEDITLRDGQFVGPDGQEVPLTRVRRGASVFSEDPGKFISYVPGRGWEDFPQGLAKRIPAGMYVRWSMHYQPTGKPERDRTLVGLYEAKGPIAKEVYTTIVRGTDIAERVEILTQNADVDIDALDERDARALAAGGGLRVIPNIPPHADNWKLTRIMPVMKDITIHTLQPHMHLRGKSNYYKVVYPDGREQVLLNVPNYDFNWQLNYYPQEPLKIPAGSTLVTVGYFDNSIKNRWNPAPDKEVYWAEQSWDEMFNQFIEYTIDSEDLTKKKGTTDN